MFRLQWTPTASRQYGDIRAQAERSLAERRRSRRCKASRVEGLFKQIHKALTLLQANPRHPGLHTHEYRSLSHPWDPGGKVFTAYAQNRTPGAYRIFWCYGPGKKDITIIAITPHPWRQENTARRHSSATSASPASARTGCYRASRTAQTASG